MIKDVVPDDQAVKWKEELKEFVAANPTVEGVSLLFYNVANVDPDQLCLIGVPEHDKQFFLL